MLVWLCFAIVLVIISVNDFLFFRLEDEYNIFLIGLYLVSCLFGVSGGNFWEALKITGVVFIACFVLNQFGLIGGGDVKLLVPLIMFAENSIFEFIWGTSIGGLVLAVAYLFFAKRIVNTRENAFLKLSELKKKKKYRLLRFVLLSLYRINKRSVEFKKDDTEMLKQEVPYGIALSCGGFFVICDVMFR